MVKLDIQLDVSLKLFNIFTYTLRQLVIRLSFIGKYNWQLVSLYKPLRKELQIFLRVFELTSW